MQVTVHTAKTNLSRLIEAVQAGEEVIIARGKEPVARLVAIKAAKFKFGLLKDQIASPPPDFLEPLDADELDAWDGKP
ncbi:type II toxin-antitoxin system Phd/YefM family antitoxin [Oryzibacter oryziterrae]|uniref:type II toxin-antitoxin system Phd/YefM family antitoxin n=1 Tax=Oryzibacter oryziterrae TaxID=2766474 RepID=UPI001EFF716C|nr:type II toxin-antitoxin system prevent-host-death family antitoxin [Oryzibacter oryziterrae]